MLRNIFWGLTVLGLAATSHAAVMITAEGMQTEGAGFEDFTTWILTATTDTDQILAFDFAGDGSTDPATGKGFFGPMSQVNPFGSPSVFESANAAIVGTGGFVSQDSQFKFPTNVITAVESFSREGQDILQALFSSNEPLGTSVVFAQLAIPNATEAVVNYRGIVSLLDGTEVPVEGSVGGGVMMDPLLAGLPGPGDVSLQSAFDDGTGALLSAIALSNANGAFGDLGALTAMISGDANGLFSAVINGENVDLMLDVAAARMLPNGTLATADLLIGSENGGSLSYTVSASVPEPSTFALAGLALLGLIGYVRRK